MDFRETFREIWSGCLYIMHVIRGKEPTSDVGAKRTAYFKEAFGRSRAPATRNSKVIIAQHKGEPDFPVEVEVEEQVDIDIEGEKQWLGLGDNYGYGLQYLRRERSDGLEVQIGRELERRGYTANSSADFVSSFTIDTPDGPAVDMQGLPRANLSTGQRRRRSWWSNIYDRISQSSQDMPLGLGLNQAPVQNRRATKSRRPATLIGADPGLLLPHGHHLDDPPPPSVMYTQHYQHHSTRLTNSGDDVLAPLPMLKMHQPRNQRSQQLFKSSSPGSKPDKALAVYYPVSSGAMDSSLGSFPPDQAPSEMDSLFECDFPTGSGSSHGIKDFDCTYPALEGNTRSRSTRAPVRDYEFGAAREYVVSQARLGFHIIPDGLTAEVVAFPSLEPHRKMSKISRSDSWHRREAAFLHPPLPSSSAQFLHPLVIVSNNGNNESLPSDPQNFCT